MRVTFLQTICGTIATICNISDSPLSLNQSTTIGSIQFLHNTAPLRFPHHAPQQQDTEEKWRRGFFQTGENEFIFHDSSNKRNPKAKRVRFKGIPNSTNEIQNNNLSQESSTNSTVSENSSTENLNPSKPKPLPWASVPSNTPSTVNLTHDRLLKSIGFLSNPKMHKAIQLSAQPTITIQDFDRNPTLDPGEIASLRAADRNTKPSPLPDNAGDIWHCDIGFGPTKAIGGAFYCLTLVDKKTRFTLIYDLKNLTTDLLQKFKQFLIDVQGTCKEIRTDFDQKIIKGRVKTFLTEKEIAVTAAPPRQQHKNGLVERKYQTILKMTRNWLTSSLLPSSYWWFAMKRAVEVSNMLPTFHTNTTHPVTPFELFYGSKPDLRNLVPMFSVVYVQQPTLQKFHSNAIKCICVGRCSISNGTLFYHPPTKRTFTDGNIVKYDFTLPAGPQFNQQYDGSFTFTSKADLNSILHRPLPFANNDTVYATHPINANIEKATVIEAPFDPTKNPFTIKFTDGTISEHMADTLQDNDPNAPLQDDTLPQANPILPWIQHDAKVPFSHPTLGPKPKWGY
jgi:hypothetical protein